MDVMKPAENSSQNRFAVRHRMLWLAFVGMILTVLPGCNYFILLGYLIGGPPQLEPLFEKETQKSFTDRGVRIAVVCYADDELKYKHDNIDHFIAARISARLQQNQIEVVNPDQVRLWLEENQDWDSPEEIGAEFDVTYVVYVDIHDFSLFERDSANLFRGRCEGMVRVYEMETDGDGREIFSRDITSAYPTQVGRPASEVSFDTFRMEYFWRLSDEIGRLFYPYGNGDDISSAT